MNTDKYKKIIMNKLDNMTEDEIYQLLLEAGLENCPYIEEGEIVLLSDELGSINYPIQPKYFYYLGAITGDSFDDFDWPSARMAA